MKNIYDIFKRNIILEMFKYSGFNDKWIVWIK